MKLSDLDPKDVQVVQSAPAASSSSGPNPQASVSPNQPTLKLSDLDPKDVQLVSSAKEGSSTTETANAATQGFAQGALMGYLPQAQAAAGALVPNPNSDVDAKLKAQGFKINQPDDTYVARRDQDIAQQEELAKNNPLAYRGAQAAGTIGGAVAGGGLLNKVPALAAGTGTLANIGKAAATGAIQGAVQNPGDVQGEVSPLQLQERLPNAALGAAGGAVGGAIGGIANKAANSIEEGAQNRAAAALGMNKGQAKRLTMLDPSGLEGQNIKKLGQYALDNGIIQPGDTIENIANKVGVMKSAVGQKIGAVYQKSTDLLSEPAVTDRLSTAEKNLLSSTDFETQKIANEYISQVKDKFKGSSGGTQIVRKAQNEMRDFIQNPDKLGIQDIQKYKQQLDDRIFTSDLAVKKGGVAEPGVEALRGFRDFLKDRIDARVDALDQVFGQSLGSDLKGLNNDYSKLSTISKITKDRLAGEHNNFLSLTDKIGAFGGATIGGAEGYRRNGLAGAAEGAATGAMLGGVSKLARTYGRPIMATGLNAAAGPAQGLITAPATQGLLGGAVNSKRKNQ